MNFLTIEKFHPRSRTSIFRKIMLGLFMLVVPTMFVTAWVIYSLDDIDFTVTSQVETNRVDNKEITLATRNN